MCQAAALCSKTLPGAAGVEGEEEEEEEEITGERQGQDGGKRDHF